VPFIGVLKETNLPPQPLSHRHVVERGDPRRITFMLSKSSGVDYRAMLWMIGSHRCDSEVQDKHRDGFKALLFGVAILIVRGQHSNSLEFDAKLAGRVWNRRRRHGYRWPPVSERPETTSWNRSVGIVEQERNTAFGVSNHWRYVVIEKFPPEQLGRSRGFPITRRRKRAGGESCVIRKDV